MQKLLSLLTVVSLLLWSTPSLVVAQTQPSDSGDAGNRSLLPLVRNGATTTTTLTAEEDEIDSGLQATGIGRELLIAAQRDVVAARALPAPLVALKLTSPVRALDARPLLTLAPSLVSGSGRQQVVVRLQELAVVQQVLAHAAASSAAQQAQLAVVQRQQATVVAAALQLDAGAMVLGQVQKALNAIMLELDAATLPVLAAHPAVRSIHPVVNYTLALSETVPYIGGAAVQALGYDGAGVSVAVLDSGIDYTHANLGGPGSLAAYGAAYGISTTDSLNTSRDGLFPTAKVVEGFDFVGESWPNGRLAPDPDPIDFAGHGTHVADIIGGVRGVAPAADLYAVKVCSAVSIACSGVALLQGMDFALDPNGDGSINDAVDVINLSLGSDYGSAADDDLSLAVEFASAYGVIVVAAAGNGSDKPYVHSTPASAPSAIAVAQTHVPSDHRSVMVIKAPAAIAGPYEAAFQSWSIAPTTTMEGVVQYGDGAGGNRNGCAPFAAGSLIGTIVLVDWDECNFTLKIVNIGQAGGLVGIIGMGAPGAPFSGADGGDRPLTIPGYLVSQATAEAIKGQLANGVVANFDPAALSLVRHIVSSSARGPAVGSNLIKPDIGAPGASVSAIAGSGAGEGPFGGTSGATPMVAGAAALLRQAFPTRTGAELKALLMNTAETNLMNRPALFGGDLAAITRIGGGEVRVDRAVHSPAAAWDVDAQTGSLSFTFQDVRDDLRLKRLVNVRNYANRPIIYHLHSTFRFADDAATSAVTMTTPITLFVPARSDAQFEINLTVDGRKLRPWRMNSGADGANPDWLTMHEYDGYLELVEEGNATNSLHLAWQILPRAAGDISLTPKPSYVRVRNRGVMTSTVESYSLIGVSTNLPQGGPGDRNPIPDYRYLGYSTFVAPAGVCNRSTPSFVLAFAANTWERQTHANIPASYRLALDTNQDGQTDYLVLTRDVGLNVVSDGRNLTWVVNQATNHATAFFFTDHETNSANTVMLLCAEQIGMTLADQGRPIQVTAYIDDFFYGGQGDVINGIVIAPFGEQYIAKFEQGGIGRTTLGAGAKDKLYILDLGLGANNTESGLLLLFRGGAELNREAGTVVILR